MEQVAKGKDTSRILVIDDEPVIRELLVDTLSQQGYLVETAEDGKSAIEKAGATFFDVVFTDIRMPGMNGVEVFKRLKEISPRTRVIVMTGYGLEEMIREALTLGAFAAVNKPFDLVLIHELVKTALEGARPADAGKNGSSAGD